MGDSTEASWKSLSSKLLDLVSDDRHLDEVARLLAKILPIYLTHERKYFHLWEQSGFHLTPATYAQPIPNTLTLNDNLWGKDRVLAGIDWNEATQLFLLQDAFPRFQDEYNRFPTEPTDRPYEFYMENPMFSGVDAIALYCMVRHFKPGLILEVGSGFSSRLSANAALRNGNSRLICIEPFPDALLKAGFPGLDSLIQSPAQEVSLDVFRQLTAGDILFIDSSHIVKCGSDVNYLFLEVLPRLAPGVIVHVHDIFLPNDYPKTWVKDLHLFYNEQYLLQAFLAYNSEFEVLFANAYLESKHSDKIRASFPNSRWSGDGSFWLRRKLS